MFFGTVLYSHDRLFYLELARSFRKNELAPEKVVKVIDENNENIVTASVMTDNLVKEFKKKGFYKWRGAPYFLYEYDLFLKSKSKTYREKLNWSDFSYPHFVEIFDYPEEEDSRDYYTIEHIYPQTPRRKCWTEKYRFYNAKQRSALRHSLGNLVPLSRPKNSSFQNKCFEEKKGSAENKVGFSYGSYSENEIAHEDEWTAVQIMERGLRLLSFLEARWCVNLGTLEEKLNILNVEFVPKVEKISIASLKKKFKQTKK